MLTYASCRTLALRSKKNWDLREPTPTTTVLYSYCYSKYIIKYFRYTFMNFLLQIKKKPSRTILMFWLSNPKIRFWPVNELRGKHEAFYVTVLYDAAFSNEENRIFWMWLQFAMMKNGREVLSGCKNIKEINLICILIW